MKSYFWLFSQFTDLQAMVTTHLCRALLFNSQTDHGTSSVTGSQKLCILYLIFMCSVEVTEVFNDA